MGYSRTGLRARSTRIELTAVNSMPMNKIFALAG
jgi:hypothetical protein